MENDIYSLIRINGPKIKDIYTRNPDCNIIVEFVRRDIFVDRFSWAVPTRVAILEIARFIGQDYCLEIGSGLGLWAYLLQQEKVNIIATDNYSDGNLTAKQVKSHKNKDTLTYLKSFNMDMNIFNYERKYFTKIEDIEASKALEKYKANCLLLCWSRINPTKDFKGNKIIYIGENKGGCTKGIPDKEWKQIKIVDIPRWVGLYDFVAFYERKTTDIYEMD